MSMAGKGRKTRSSVCACLAAGLGWVDAQASKEMVRMRGISLPTG